MGTNWILCECSLLFKNLGSPAVAKRTFKMADEGNEKGLRLRPGSVILDGGGSPNKKLSTLEPRLSANAHPSDSEPARSSFPPTFSIVAS